MDKRETVAKASCPVPLRKLFVTSVPEDCNELKLSIYQGNRSLGQVCTIRRIRFKMGIICKQS